jgi:hypothetical protein
LIVKHLIYYTSVNIVYAVTDKVDYYKKLGFVEVQTKVKELENSLVNACRMSNKKLIIMLYEKNKDYVTSDGRRVTIFNRPVFFNMIPYLRHIILITAHLFSRCLKLYRDGSG